VTKWCTILAVLVASTEPLLLAVAAWQAQEQLPLLKSKAFWHSGQLSKPHCGQPRANWLKALQERPPLYEIGKHLSSLQARVRAKKGEEGKKREKGGEEEACLWSSMGSRHSLTPCGR
jgi:hypothetical protein